MAGAHAGDVSAFIVTVGFAGILAAAEIHYLSIRTPAGIVRQLSRGAHQVSLRVNHLNLSTWDPSKPIGRGEIHGRGIATYTLIDSTTVRLVFNPDEGRAFERSGPIPIRLQPALPATIRRRWIARAVVAAYLALGTTAFILTATLVSGSDAFRERTGGLAGSVTIAVAWLFTHTFFLHRRRHRTKHPDAGGVPTSVRSHHPLYWLLGIVVISPVLGVAWHLQSSTDTNPPSWASSFLAALVFVVVSAATIAAASHHHTYVNHADHLPK